MPQAATIRVRQPQPDMNSISTRSLIYRETFILRSSKLVEQRVCYRCDNNGDTGLLQFVENNISKYAKLLYSFTGFCGAMGHAWKRSGDKSRVSAATETHLRSMLHG